MLESRERLQRERTATPEYFMTGEVMLKHRALFCTNYILWSLTLSNGLYVLVEGVSGFISVFSWGMTCSWGVSTVRYSSPFLTLIWAASSREPSFLDTRSRNGGGFLTDILSNSKSERGETAYSDHEHNLTTTHSVVCFVLLLKDFSQWLSCILCDHAAVHIVCFQEGLFL